MIYSPHISELKPRPANHPPIEGRAYTIGQILSPVCVRTWLNLYPMSHGEARAFIRAQMKPADFMLVECRK